jgi:hypothetical protein
MKIAAICALTLTFSVSAFSQTSVPPAPTLTVGAQFKGLTFDWDSVPGATSYQLEYRANQTGPFVQHTVFPASYTSTAISFPLHLYNWTYARYRLAACNSAGCSRSPAVSVSALRRDAVGYFKAAQPRQRTFFGDRVDLSPNGNNMVATAPFENTYSGDIIYGGSVYVFRKGGDRRWRQRARIDAQSAAYGESEIFLSTAISASGDTVAVGLPTTFTDGASGYGEVDIYQATNNVWSRTRVPRPADADDFGWQVALNDAGDILAVDVNDGNNSLIIYRLINGTWQNVRQLSETSLSHPEWCNKIVLSRDGTTIAEFCEEPGTTTRVRRNYIRVHSGPNWSVRTDITLSYPANNNTFYNHQGLSLDRTGDTLAVQFGLVQNGTVQTDEGAVKVYKRASGVYSEVTTLTPGPWRNTSNDSFFGQTLSLSGDGQTLAVGDAADNGNGWGPRAAPLISGTAQTGAVYVYRLKDTWKLANMVKPNYNPNPPGQTLTFPEHVVLNGDGKSLIVAAPRESSSASGIDGDWANYGRPGSGAIFMY